METYDEDCFQLVAQISPKFGFRLVSGQIAGECFNDDRNEFPDSSIGYAGFPCKPLIFWS